VLLARAVPKNTNAIPPEGESTTSSFENLLVVAFESRKAKEMAALISRQNGIPMIAPAMREIPLEENPAAFGFAEELLAHRLNAVLFLTGAGTRLLLEVLRTRYSLEDIVCALAGVLVVARGPKPLSVLREYQIPVNVAVPEPNTWHEVLEKLDERAGELPMRGSRIAIQEYGAPNFELSEELTKRGVEVVRVPVYRWGMPEDCGPAVVALTAIIAGQCRVLLFTNALQVENVMKIAASNGLMEVLLDAIRQCVVCSVGPICSAALRANNIAVDVEPEHPKMGFLVHEAARRAPTILRSREGS
jgi:uroporphyrinogen-III synthase